MKVLVTGGVRSGKSRHAEALLSAGEPVTYVAPGPVPDADHDPDWAARVAAHRLRRPVAWSTHETGDLEAAVAGADGPVLVDCLGTWLTAALDHGTDGTGLWDASSAATSSHVDALLTSAAAVVEAHDHDVVLVTNEVGLGVVPAHRSGRVFRDLLGTVNQRLAEVCDEVHLVVAGRVLRL